jgi:hypothetical protein
MIASRRRPGTTSRRSSKRLPARSLFISDKPVRLLSAIRRRARSAHACRSASYGDHRCRSSWCEAHRRRRSRSRPRPISHSEIQLGSSASDTNIRHAGPVQCRKGWEGSRAITSRGGVIIEGAGDGRLILGATIHAHAALTKSSSAATGAGRRVALIGSQNSLCSPPSRRRATPSLLSVQFFDQTGGESWNENDTGSERIGLF